MKQWEKPELIVLQRGQPEERILAACKTRFDASGTVQFYDYQCDNPTLGCLLVCEPLAES
jgi:hypothetical protein